MYFLNNHLVVLLIVVSISAIFFSNCRISPIDEIKTDYNIHEECYGNMLVAVTEAVNNAIQHGNKSNPEKKIDIIFRPDKDIINCYVSDEGNGFDYSNLPDPTDPENVEKLNGRGVFLMKHLADAVAFHENGRIVQLSFKSPHMVA